MTKKKDIFDIMYEDPDLTPGEAYNILKLPQRILLAVAALIIVVGVALLYFS